MSRQTSPADQLKVLANFGLTDQDIADRSNCSAEVISSIRAGETTDPGPGICLTLTRLVHEQSQRTLDYLQNDLRLSPKEIAGLLDRNPSTISRIHNHPDWPVGLDSASGLALLRTRQERARVEHVICHSVASTTAILDTYCSQGGNLGEDTRTQLRTAVLAALIGALTNSSTPTPLPDGIHAVLATLGHPDLSLFAILVEPKRDNECCLEEAQRLSRIAHELTDLLRRINGRIDQLENRPVNTVNPLF